MTCFVFNAELDSLVCSGRETRQHQTILLDEERRTNRFIARRSIADLARRFYKPRAGNVERFVCGGVVADAKKVCR